MNGFKKRLDDANANARDLWTYRTTLHRSTKEMPFSVTYGSKAVIPLEIGFPTLRISLFTLNSNDNLLRKSLDLVEECRENAMI